MADNNMNNNNNNNNNGDVMAIYTMVGGVKHSPPHPFPAGSPYFLVEGPQGPRAALRATLEPYGGDQGALHLDLLKWRDGGAITIWNGERGWTQE